MSLTKTQAVVGTIAGFIAIAGYVSIPDEWAFATRAWVIEMFGGQLAKVDYSYRRDLILDIVHYEKQACYGTDTSRDIVALEDVYELYLVETGHEHEYRYQAQKSVCEKLRVPYENGQ